MDRDGDGDGIQQSEIRAGGERAKREKGKGMKERGREKVTDNLLN